MFIFLTVGISIDTLSIANYEVEGLYIKVDKKLILKANKVIIPKRKASPNVAKIDEVLERIKYGLTFFEHIDLKNIHFDNNILGIYYHNNIMQVESKDYLIRGSVHRKGNSIQGSIPMLYLKKKKITMYGKFAYDLAEEVLHVKGTYALKQLSGNFVLKKDHDEVDFSLNSKTFSDLDTLVEGFEIPTSIRRWAVEKVQAKSYKIDYFTAKGKIVDKAFTLDKQSLEAKVTFSDVEIDFNQKLAPILAHNLILNYKHSSGLLFTLDKPSYLGKDLEGSSVSIKHFAQRHTTLYLHLKFNTRFDEEIKNLLKAYTINLPIVQKSGKVKASVDIAIGLKQKFLSVESDVDFEKGFVWIKGIKLPIVSGNIHYQDSKILLHRLQLKNDTYFGNLSGTLDIKKKRLSASFDAHYIRLGEKKERLLDIKNHKIPFVLDYGKVLTVDVPVWGISFEVKKKISTLKLDNLKKISPYISKEIPIKEGGKATLITEDFKTYRFLANLNRSTCFLYENTNACASKLSVKGKITPSNVDFYAFGKRLYFNKAKSLIKINNLNIDLKKLLEREEETGKKTKKKTKKSSKLLILGTKSNFRYDEYNLLSDSYDVEIDEKGDISAISSYDGDIIKFKKHKENISLQALRIKDKALHALINFDGLQKGRYSLKKTGNPKIFTKGEIIVEGGVMKGFQAYNNTLAFIRSLPAFSTLESPAYSNEGFRIKTGLVNYRMIKKDFIVFDSIHIEGESVTIEGKGKIDLKFKTIDMKLTIHVARELGKAVSRIPLLGYILAGEEQGVTIRLSITGLLDKPQVNTSAGKDLLTYPINLIKRTIDAPRKLLSGE